MFIADYSSKANKNKSTLKQKNDLRASFGKPKGNRLLLQLYSRSIDQTWQ